MINEFLSRARDDAPRGAKKWKPLGRSTASAFMLAAASLGVSVGLRAQPSQAAQAVPDDVIQIAAQIPGADLAAIRPVQPSELPLHFTAWSAQCLLHVPAARPAGDSPVQFYSLDASGRVLLEDDRALYATPAGTGEAAMRAAGVPQAGIGQPAAVDYPADALYLEILDISDKVRLALHHTHSGVRYIVESRPSLAAGRWVTEGSVTGTNDGDVTITALSIGTSRDSLFLWAYGCSNDCPDALPSAWQLHFFNRTGLNPADDLDGDGLSLLDEWLDGIDPNKIKFSVSVTNQYVNSSQVPVALTILGGLPSSMAVLVDSTNFAAADWGSCYLNFNVNLGAGPGWHDVWIGLRGLPADAHQTWEWTRVKVVLSPPLLIVTNPVSSTVSQPMIELQGCSPEPLRQLTYDITNDAGSLTGLQALVLDEYYDTNTWAFTTNYFQAFDIPLTNGLNTITLHATDLAGNSTNATLIFTLEYSGKTNPPAVKLYWPQDGTQVSGSNFTWRGWVDDFTATLQAQVVDADGNTNSINALVERDGNFWAEDLPLAAGRNILTLIATDAANNVNVTNISVVKSSMALTIDPLNDDQLGQPTTTVWGTIDTPDYAVWVNGRLATQDGNGGWIATNVATTAGGTAVVQARAVPNSDNGGHGTGGSGGGAASYADPGNPGSSQATDAETQTSKPMRIYVDSDTQQMTYDPFYHKEFFDEQEGRFGWEETKGHGSVANSWADGAGGGGSLHYDHNDEIHCDGGGGALWHFCDLNYSWPPTSWPDLVYGNRTVSGECGPDADSTAPQPVIGLEHCEISADLWNAEWTMAPVYPDEGQCGTAWFTSASLHYPYVRHAQTKMKLFTGGKGVPNRECLFDVAASAWEILDKGAQPPYEPHEIFPYPRQTIPYEDLTVGGLGQLGSDGRLYKALHDNVSVDVTVSAPRQFYTYAVTATKHRLLITANGVILRDDRVIRTAKFCVGQKMNFQAYFVPDVPGLASANPRWNFTGRYVNTHYTDNNGCEIYIIAPYWMTQNPTHVWYYNGGQSLSAYAGMYCEFNNGQTAFVTARGLFDVHRPGLTGWVTPSNAVLSLYPTAGDTWTLRVGRQDKSAAMEWLLYVASEYGGAVGVTQVYDDQSYPDAKGANVLDLAEFYPYHAGGNFDLSPVYTGNPSQNPVSLVDSPHETSHPLDSFVTLVIQFRDYVRFRPDVGDPAENIFVTLGKVTWSVNATGSSGTLSGSITGPSLINSDEFPYWEKVR